MQDTHAEDDIPAGSFTARVAQVGLLEGDIRHPRRRRLFPRDGKHIGRYIGGMYVTDMGRVGNRGRPGATAALQHPATLAEILPSTC